MTHIFPMETKQIEIHEQTGKKALGALRLGFNTTILAYGQTGSGTQQTTHQSQATPLERRAHIVQPLFASRLSELCLMVAGKTVTVDGLRDTKMPQMPFETDTEGESMEGLAPRMLRDVFELFGGDNEVKESQ